MRKLVLVGCLLALSTGCGRSWFPHLFRGAPCGSGLCSTPAPMVDDCQGCSGMSSGYESYGDMGTVMGGEYIGGTPSMGSVPSSSVPMNNTIAPPSAPALPRP